MVGDHSFEYVFVVVPKLSRAVILGCDWLSKFKIKLDFDRGCFVGPDEWECNFEKIETRGNFGRNIDRG